MKKTAPFHLYFDVSGETLVTTLLRFAGGKNIPGRVHVYAVGNHHFPEVKIDPKSIKKTQTGVLFLGTPYKRSNPCPPVYFFWNQDLSDMPELAQTLHFRVAKIRWDP